MSNSLHHFLPALLEIQESPPNPIAQRLLFAIIAFVVIAILWACIGKVDVVSVAEGHIIPSSRVKQVQPLMRGVVKEIRVQEGQQVKAGDVLVVLDRTSTGAGLDSASNEQQRLTDVLEREKALLAMLEKPCAESQATVQIQQKDLLRQQYDQFCAQYAALQSQRENRNAEREVNKEMIRKLEATLPVITQRANNTKGLTDKKLAMENDYLALEEMRLSQTHDLAAAKVRDAQLAAASKESEKQIAGLVAQTKAQALTAIADGERQLNALQEQFAKAQDMDARQILYAPVAGQVKDLAINTVGGVVLEAQQLMLIVPEEETLEVEAWLPNKDIGFVQEGAQAQVKVHTFPFSKYGTIPAVVTRISDDAVSSDKQAPDKQKAGGGEKGNEAMFSMSLVMEKNTLQVEGREVKLVPGMQVTAEVITHQRRLIEYFFSPMKKQFQESVHER